MSAVSSVRTRRQAAAVSSPATPTPAPKEELAVKGNGNGSAHKTPKTVADPPKENIFLFWPNIIGKFRGE
jgi:CDP-diacylglycerol--inositol 3-phosphatidyltransferase